MVYAIKLLDSCIGDISYKREVKKEDDQNSYNLLFSPELNPISTTYGYTKILELIPDNSLVYDIGVGSGIYFNSDNVVSIIKEKNLKIICVDLDMNAIKLCQKRLINKHLTEYISAKCTDFTNCEILEGYDNVVSIFCESLPLMDKHIFSILFNHAIKLGSNHIFAYQNLDETNPLIRKYGKKILTKLTGCDFGRELDIKTIENMSYPYKPKIVDTKCIKPNEIPLSRLVEKGLSVNKVWWWVIVSLLAFIKFIGHLSNNINTSLETKQCIVEWKN